MAVYGDMIAYFNELKRGFSNYEIKPLLVAGKEERQLIKHFVGIFQYMKHTDINREGETLNAVTQPTLWTKEDLKQGTFVVADFEPDILYIVKEKNNYIHEGDFTLYVLETSVGAADTQTENKDFTYGEGNFG